MTKPHHFSMFDIKGWQSGKEFVNHSAFRATPAAVEVSLGDVLAPGGPRCGRTQRLVRRTAHTVLSLGSSRCTQVLVCLYSAAFLCVRYMCIIDYHCSMNYRFRVYKII